MCAIVKTKFRMCKEAVEGFVEVFYCWGWSFFRCFIHITTLLKIKKMALHANFLELSI